MKIAIQIDTYLDKLQKTNPGVVDPQRVFDTGRVATPATPEAIYYNVVLYFLYICGFVAVLVLIYGGILYITSAGEAEKSERAKKTISGAIIGIIVIMLSYSTYNFIIGRL